MAFRDLRSILLNVQLFAKLSVLPLADDEMCVAVIYWHTLNTFRRGGKPILLRTIKELYRIISMLASAVERQRAQTGYGLKTVKTLYKLRCKTLPLKSLNLVDL